LRLPSDKILPSAPEPDKPVPMRVLNHLLSFLFAAALVQGQATYNTVIEEDGPSGATGDFISNGVITPLDQEMKHFYIRNADGAIEVKLAQDALVGLQTRVPSGALDKRKIELSIGDQSFSYDLPADLYVKRTFKDAKTVERFLQTQDRPLFNGKLYLKPIADHFPTEDEPWIAGRFIKENGRYMEVQVGEQIFQISTQGYDGQHRFMGLLTHKDIKPFVQQAFVHGRMIDHVFHASEVGIRMLENSKAKDDPKLGRYLFIGDSISGNYDKALRAALQGKLNVYHPPTNCGSVGKGVQNMAQWMGAYDQAGFEWDIISFNFGQWDSKSTQAKYQADLETVIAILQKTKARLIFVTTTPIPRGYAGPGELNDQGQAPGRVQETMQRFINPWALEVMARHPEIDICDQHRLIMNEPFYTTWLAHAGLPDGGSSKEYGDLHIGGLLGEPVGRQLARKVLDVLGREQESLSPHSLNENDLHPDRQRASTRGLDVDDYIDLLANEARLRAYNRQP
jgi:hypothetical protein